MTTKKGGIHMELKYNVSGSERKRMVVAIGKALQVDPVYKGTPSYAFKVGEYCRPIRHFDWPGRTGDEAIGSGISDGRVCGMSA